MSEYGVGNTRMPFAGVSAYNPKRVTYSPKKHNPSAPVRPGATDALHCASRDHTPVLKPYWALKNN